MLVGRLSPEDRAFSAELREVVQVTAKTGCLWHDWAAFRALLLLRLEQAISEYLAGEQVEVGPPRPHANAHAQLSAALDSFQVQAPFTIQRLCEVLLAPKETYRTLDKFTLALEKLLFVTTLASAPYCTDLADVTVSPQQDGPSPPLPQQSNAALSVATEPIISPNPSPTPSPNPDSDAANSISPMEGVEMSNAADGAAPNSPARL
eukprot:jgi/Chlat1/367/Chrsp10S08625